MSILGVVGGLASNIFNIAEQRRTNRQSMDFSREMWDKQGKRELDFWNLQNAYNDPSAQMKRLESAGLNPNLVYGNGATTESASLSPKSAGSASINPARLDLGSVMQQTLALSQMKSQIDKTKAETDAVKALTTNRVFDNEVRQNLGIDYYLRQANLSNAKLAGEANTASAKGNKDQLDWDAYLMASSGAFESGTVNAFNSFGHTFDQNSPIYKAQKAGLQKFVLEFDLAKKLGNLRDAETALKQFEVNLTKQGIPPNSPWYYKIIGDVLQKILGFNLGEAGNFIGSFNPLNQ